MRNNNAGFLLQFGCSQEAHNHSTQQSKSIQTGAKKQVKARRLFNLQSLHMMMTKKQLSALLLFCAMSGTAYSENLYQVYLHAQSNDAQLKASESAFLAMQEKRPQALSALKPQVNLSASGTYSTQFTSRVANRADGGAAFLNFGYTLNLTQPLYRKSINVQIDQANASILQAQASLEADQQSLMLRVADAYIAYLKAKDNAKFAKLETNSILRQLNQVKAYFDAGRLAITDVKEAQARYDLSRAQEVSVTQQIDIAKENLRAITGHYYNNLLGTANSIPLIQPQPNNIETWSKAAVANSKAVHIAEHAVVLAQSNIDLARAGKSPTVDLFARHSGSTTHGESIFDQDKFDAAVGIQVNIPLYTGGSVASRTREARHLLQQSRYKLESQKRAATQQTRAAYLATISGLSQVKALKQALISNQTAAKATRTGFKVGTRTAVDVLVSLRETFRSQRDYTTARYDFLLNTLKLKQAAGILKSSDLQGLSNLLNQANSSSAQVTKYRR
ncbi:MAG TPA: type I secretion protein TolC [Leucothrix mucor]|nr:type I secretion protein TolC [Leucothrix mucor]